MLANKEAPTVPIYWSGRGTADAVGEAIADHDERDSMPSLAGGARPPMRGLQKSQAGLYGWA